MTVQYAPVGPIELIAVQGSLETQMMPMEPTKAELQTKAGLTLPLQRTALGTLVG